jgi:hypothetical protein
LSIRAGTTLERGRRASARSRAAGLRARLGRQDGRSDEAFEALDELQAELQEALFGPGGFPVDRPTEIEPNDPRLELLLDALAALGVLESDDPAYPWERGWLLSLFERHLEAAENYMTATRLFTRDAATGTGTTGDEEDWAKSALFHASRNLALGGHPTAAAALLPQLDPDDRAEVERLIDAKASETIL